MAIHTISWQEQCYLHEDYVWNPRLPHRYGMTSDIWLKWHSTDLWRINAFHISGVPEKYRENFPMKLTSKFIIFINEFTLSFNHTITEA